MAHWTREVTGATVVELARNLPLRALGSCSWKGVSLVTTCFHALQEMGNREDWSAEGACQAKTREPESTPLSNCNMFRWDQRIALKTDKPNNRSQNREK